MFIGPLGPMGPLGPPIGPLGPPIFGPMWELNWALLLTPGPIEGLLFPGIEEGGMLLGFCC